MKKLTPTANSSHHLLLIVLLISVIGCIMLITDIVRQEPSETETAGSTETLPALHISTYLYNSTGF